jgi:hypothetical protein
MTEEKRVFTDTAQALWETIEEHIDLGIPPYHLVRNLGLFETPITTARTLWFSHLYEKLTEQTGVIIEFGVYWGRDLVLWENLRAIHEPGYRGSYRRIIGFDTFQGHTGTTSFDGGFAFVQEGAFSVPEDWVETFLGYMQARHNITAEPGLYLVGGDVRTSLPEWLRNNPDATVALAYLDLDLYLPTLHVLRELKERCRTGSVIAFDEAGSLGYPGELQAVNEVFPDERLHRYPLGNWSYIQVGT